MKTFKLKSLTVLFPNDDDKKDQHVSLLDGLIIDREDDQKQWVIEAFIPQDYYDFFTALEERDEKVYLEVKITKESNAPAYFLTEIVSLQKIDQNMNVVFIGKLVDHREYDTIKILEQLIEQGYDGEKLLSMFRKRLNHRL